MAADSLIPALVTVMIVRLMRVAAVNMGKDPDLKQALLPKIAAFRRDGNLMPFIFTADEVLGGDWLDVGFAHATPTQFDNDIRSLVGAARRWRDEGHL